MNTFDRIMITIAIVCFIVLFILGFLIVIPQFNTFINNQPSIYEYCNNHTLKECYNQCKSNYPGYDCLALANKYKILEEIR